ncbi:hypothetical protein MNBD_NITROSPINAE04-318 [hydrothermal vent metagenome]|uniref:Uncharacterized protein n=1 Tax=hydrothermal vent metagenome TaxID=652676 RepID=A0A3B1CAD6_9ZZZZ
MEDHISEPGKGGLRLHKEDEALAYGEMSDDSDFETETQVYVVSYIKLFFTIIISAPVAVFLSLMVYDAYSGFAVSVGLKKERVVQAPVRPAPAPVAKKDDKLGEWLSAFKKSNRKLVASLEKQTAAISKLANKKPQIVKIETPKGKKTRAKEPRIIVIKVPSREKFDLNYEKQKIYELAGLDMDDPITSAKLFNAIKSRDVLKELIRSFNLIIAASRDHDEVSDFLKSNAMTGKKYATRRLKKVR